jgi:uncharacterized membrane protein
MKNQKVSFFKTAKWLYVNLFIFGIMVAWTIYNCISHGVVYGGTYVSGF